ncbi:MAG: TIGR03557 family F420-dependent LLM class oxidoreductase [Candidatus Woykebacteria bacterium]
MARFFFSLEHEQFQPEKIVGLAKLVEEAGFDGIAVSEHFHPWVDDIGAGGFAFSTLGAIAAVTKKVRLMTNVVSPLFRYHPAIVAQAAATIDRLSSGRFELGVGTGWSLNESPLGYKFPNYKERAERMREALEIMRRLLDGEKLTYTGKYYKTDRAKLYSPPNRKIPIYMAAAGPKSAALAGQKTDGVIVSVKNPAESLQKVIEPAKKAATSAGRTNPKIIASRWTIIARDYDEAWKAIQPWRGLRVPGRDKAVDPQDLRMEADMLGPKELLKNFTLVQDQKELTEVYSTLIEELGADTVVTSIASTNPESIIKMVAKQVLPTLKKL